MIGQIILLREFLTVFYGNEIVYAVVFASWLFWIAVGSLVLSRLVRRISIPQKVWLLFQVLLGVLLPLTVIAVRCSRFILGARTGEILGVTPMLSAAVVVLAPVAFLFGGTFALLCCLGAEKTTGHDENRNAGTVYLWESLGAAIGGAVFSFILVQFWSALQMMFLIAGMNIFLAWVFFRPTVNLRRMALAMASFVAVAAVVTPGLEQFSRRTQWQGLAVERIGDSVYGNIAVITNGREVSIFENGLLSATTMDHSATEDKVHFPLLTHPDPTRVLLIGSGIDGTLQEILKYPKVLVTLVQLDPKVLEMASPFLPADIRAAWHDPRVHILSGDGRLWIKRMPEKGKGRRYDVVIINLGDPYNALINRYYTRDFLKEAEKILAPDGVLSLSVSSSENYLNAEAKEYLRAVNTTLRQVFPDVKAIPGDTNIFLACRQQGLCSNDPKFFVTRLRERKISTQYFRESSLPFKLSPDRIGYIEGVLQQNGDVNTDLHPMVYFTSVTYWAAQFDAGLKVFLQKVKGLQLAHVLLLPLMMGLVGLWIRKIRPLFPVELSLATTGMSQIVFQLLVIMAFQSLYGYAYYQLGWILTAFMVGLAGGSFQARRMVGLPKEKISVIYRWLQLGISVYPLLVPVAFWYFHLGHIRLGGGDLNLFAITFAALPLLAGFLGGMQYPLAVSLVERYQPKMGGERIAGGLYALDVFGATVGALVTGTILIPVMGIQSTALFFAALNFVVCLLLVSQPAKDSPRV